VGSHIYLSPSLWARGIERRSRSSFRNVNNNLCVAASHLIQVIPSELLFSQHIIMSTTDWVLVIGLSIPAMAIMAWMRLLKNEVEDAKQKKND
jgi:hypothetical protein